MTDKRVVWWYNEVIQYGSDDKYYRLTEQQAYMLRAVIPQMKWGSRYLDGEPSLDWREEMAGEVSERLMSPMEFCDLMADCIENNTGVQTAIRNYLASQGYGSGQTPPPTTIIYTDDPPVLDGGEIVGCGNDNLFGGVTGLVDLMNSIIEDAFEAFELATTAGERLGAILEAIPFTNILALDDALQFADQLLEQIAQNYAGEYTQALRDEYRCDLFCLVKDTCELDFQVFADYFAQKVGFSINPNDAFEAGMQWFITGVFTSEAIVHAPHALLAQVIAYGGQFFSADPAWLFRATTALMNDPDSDWNVLCDCTDPTCWFIGTINGNIAGIDNGDGTFTSTNVGGSNPNRVVIRSQGQFSQFNFDCTEPPVASPELCRFWDSQETGGTLVFSGTWASAVAASPIVAARCDISSDNPFTIALAMGVDKC